MYTVKDNGIIIDRNTGGFFSCCSIRLEAIIDYFNKNKIVPNHIDSSIQFDFYKTHSEKGKDVCENYFLTDTQENININLLVKYSNNDQFKRYETIDYTNICPFVRKYFSPNTNTQNIITYIENKYKINYNNICTIFFRGNDKILETSLPEYSDYINNARILKNNNPSLKFLIQSDETQFIDCMIEEFKTDTIVFRDEIRHMSKSSKTSVDGLYHTLNNEFSKKFLAIIIIMSKSKHIICNTGNCSIWILFYRENSENVIQLPK